MGKYSFLSTEEKLKVILNTLRDYSNDNSVKMAGDILDKQEVKITDKAVKKDLELLLASGITSGILFSIDAIESAVKELRSQ